MQHSIIRSGRHSLAVIIPAKFIHALGIKAQDKVHMDINLAKGKIILQFSGAMQLPLLTQKKKIN